MFGMQQKCFRLNFHMFLTIPIFVFVGDHLHIAQPVKTKKEHRSIRIFRDRFHPYVQIYVY